MKAESGKVEPAVFQFLATIFDMIMFGAAIYKMIEGLLRYVKHGGHSMLALISAYSFIYFACVYKLLMLDEAETYSKRNRFLELGMDVAHHFFRSGEHHI